MAGNIVILFWVVIVTAELAEIGGKQMPFVFKIRDEQMQALGAGPSNNFREKLLKALLIDVPKRDPGLTPQEIELRMDKALALAPDYGMETRNDYARFCFLYVGLAQEIENNPEFSWINHILSGAAHGEYKLNQIEKLLNAASE